MYLGKNIRYLRKSQGMTQEELAERLGLQYSAIGKWEREDNLPSANILVTLSDLFSVNLDDLVKVDLSARPQVQGKNNGQESTAEVMDEIAELNRRLQEIEQSQRTAKDLERHRLAIRKVMKQFPDFGKELEDEFDL